MKFPDKRSVTLKKSKSENFEVDVTILKAEPGNVLGHDNHGIIDKVHETDPKKAKKLTELMNKLISKDDIFFKWLEADPENTMLFVNDPVAAINAAIKDLPLTLFEEIAFAAERTVFKKI